MPKGHFFKKIFSLGLAAVLSFSCFTVFAEDRTGMFDSGMNYSCEYFYFEHLDSGTVIIDKNSKEQCFPASMSKVMTALLAIEAIEKGDIMLVDEVTATYADLNDTKGNDTSTIERGDTVTVEQLLYCVLVHSSNVGCNMLARYISGGIPAFVALMNGRAKELNCVNTNFTNTHGLHEEDNYTCAYDVGVIFKESLKYDLMKKLLGTKDYKFENKAGESKYIYTTNFLLDDSRCNIFDGYTYEYEYFLGGRAGYTKDAGACLVSYAQRDGQTYMCVAMGDKVKTEKNTNFAMKDTKETYIWAFANISQRAIVDPNKKVAEIPVTLSFDSEFVSVMPAQEITALIPNDYDISTLPYTLSLPESLEAPIEKGQVLGSMVIKFGDEVLGKVDLIADRNIAKSNTLGAVSKFEKFMGTWWFWAIIGVLAALLVVYLLIALTVNLRRRRSNKRNSAKYRRSTNKYRSGKRFR